MHLRVTRRQIDSRDPTDIPTDLCNSGRVSRKGQVRLLYDLNSRPNVVDEDGRFDRYNLPREVQADQVECSLGEGIEDILSSA